MDKAMIKSLEERIEALKQNVAAVLVGRERATEYILSWQGGMCCLRICPVQVKQ